jgi:hypothetical protein
MKARSLYNQIERKLKHAVVGNIIHYFGIYLEKTRNLTKIYAETAAEARNFGNINYKCYQLDREIR